MMILWKRLMAVALVVLLLPVAALAQPAATATPEPNEQGMPYVLTAFEGSPLDVSQYAGKALFLNFFTGWCGYCMQEMPEIKEIYDAYDPNEVAIVLVHVWDGETAEESAAVVKQYGLEELNLVEDEQFQLATLIGLTGYPTSIFIDKEGYLYGGVASGLDFDTMAQYLDGMNVAKRAVTTP